MPTRDVLDKQGSTNMQENQINIALGDVVAHTITATCGTQGISGVFFVQND
jgi:hypothetical protein